MNSQHPVAKASFGSLSLELQQKIFSLALNVGARRDRIRTAQILGSLNRAARSAICAPLIDLAIRTQNNIDNILTPRVAALSPLLASWDFYRHFKRPKVSVAVLKVEIFLQRCRDEDNARREVAWLLYFVAWIESKKFAENAKVRRNKEVARTEGTIWGTGTTRNRRSTRNTGTTRNTGSARNREVWWVTHTYTGASPRSSRDSSLFSVTSKEAVYSPSVETSQSGEHDRVAVEDSNVLTASNNLPIPRTWSPCMEAAEFVEQDHVRTESSKVAIISKDVRKPQNWKNRAKAWLSRTVKQKISTTACKLFRSHRKR